MNILFHMEQIRRLLAARGTCEVPQFPEPLAEVWYHPDILLAMRDNRLLSNFCFQTMWLRGTGVTAEGLGCVPALVWQMNCSEKDFCPAVVDFVSDLHFAITSSREDSGFALVAERGKTLAYGERGCCWRLQYNGVSCGRICLFSEVFYQALPKPAAVLILDLARLTTLLSTTDLGSPVPWSANTVVDDLLALKAWEIRGQIDGKSLLQKREPDARIELCRLISYVNSGAFDNGKDGELLRQLAGNINASMGQIMLERGKDKKVAVQDVIK